MWKKPFVGVGIRQEVTSSRVNPTNDAVNLTNGTVNLTNHTVYFFCIQFPSLQDENWFSVAPCVTYNQWAKHMLRARQRRDSS